MLCCSARKTSPMPPRPSLLTILKLPIVSPITAVHPSRRGGEPHTGEYDRPADDEANRGFLVEERDRPDGGEHRLQIDIGGDERRFGVAQRDLHEAVRSDRRD